MLIEDDIHLVLSGAMGFDLTNPFDCNVFMLRAGEDWIIFDSGAGIDDDEMFAAFEKTGIPARNLRHLFLTHAHADHAGGAAVLKDRFGVQIYAGDQTADMLEAGDDVKNGLARARDAGIYPSDYRFRAAAVDRRVAEYEVITINDVCIQMICTPGHSFDHVSYLVKTPDLADIQGRTILIVGDALFCGGKVVIQDIPDCNIGDICASIRKLAAPLGYEVFLPGHFNFSLRNGTRHAETAMTYVRQFQCPPSAF